MNILQYMFLIMFAADVFGIAHIAWYLVAIPFAINVTLNLIDARVARRLRKEKEAWSRKLEEGLGK